MKFLSVLMVMLSASFVQANPIKHRFLVTDEPGHQLVYIDENNPSENWALPLVGNRAWDMQLIGNDQLCVSFIDGYYVVDLNVGQIVETVRLDELSGIWSVRRHPNGKTMVVGMDPKQGLYVAELDAKNKVVHQGFAPNAQQMRLGRITEEGHGVAAPGSEVIEWNLDGKIVNRFDLPAALAGEHGIKAFMGLKDADGNYWVGCGYGAVTLKLDPTGTVIQTFGASEGMHFTAGFQLLENGNMVQAQWSGHNKKSAPDRAQLLEFNPAGEVVWTYHNPDAFFCPLSVIILDDLCTKKAAGDSAGVLHNFK